RKRAGSCLKPGASAQIPARLRSGLCSKIRPPCAARVCWSLRQSRRRSAQMPASQADAYLIQAVQRGDADAWRSVIDRYQGRLVSFARRMLATPADAEDLVQETFLGLMRSLRGYDPERSLETYLFAILRHKLNDHFRRAHKGQRQSLEQLDLDETPAAW